MKIWLDDIRKAPIGWVGVNSAAKAIKLLKNGNVKIISLDHDLGENRKTGYDVVVWIEKEVATNNFEAPLISIHSDNPVGRKKIEAAIEKIAKLTQGLGNSMKG